MSFPGYISLSPVDAKAISAKKSYPLGARGITLDGRSFAYALAGEALSVGIPLNPVALGGLAVGGQDVMINDTENLTSTSSQIVLSSTNSTWGALLNEYADGYLVVESSTQSSAQGQHVRIKTNTAGSTSTTDSPFETIMVFEDDDRFLSGVTTSDEVSVTHNEYFDVIEHDGGATSLPIIGVPIRDVTDNFYFWAQTFGPCPVLNDGTTVYGEKVLGSTQSDQGVQPMAAVATTTDTGVSGLVPLISGTERPAIGWVLGPSPGDGDYCMMFLTIRP